VPSDDNATEELALHRLSWADFDELARGRSSARVVRRLRRAERSRRLLLLRALVDEATKVPNSCGPLSSPESAWELLERVQGQAPATLDLILEHPYTGSWAGYTTRLLHNKIAGVCPLWVHIGYLHAIAAAAAIRAGLRFEISVPVWNGGAILPTLGMARLPTAEPFLAAEIRGGDGPPEVRAGTVSVRLPHDYSLDAPGWWPIRNVRVRADHSVLLLRLDDLDPYRGLYEPVLPQRLGTSEVATWCALLTDAWHIIVRYLPETVPAFQTGLVSLVPRPAVPFRMPSASTGEAFGSAVVGLPDDAPGLANTLVHEFQHILLGGLLHLAHLRDDDPRERFYVPWRDDPRPLPGLLQGVYAFFGVTMFWRALAHARHTSVDRRAAFEFAYWREATWRVLSSLQDDSGLTPAGRRFLAGVAERLGPWRHEPVPGDLAALAALVAADHYAGWRIRHVRPRLETVETLARAWLAGLQCVAGISAADDRTPTPVPDGSWSQARPDMIRLGLAQPAGTDSLPQPPLSETWQTVPDATRGDFAYASGHFAEAARIYTAELAADPDRPASWIGLGLALSRLHARPAARALLSCPELVRAVHRRIRTGTEGKVAADELAGWIGRHLD
jgi:HEXXH motif-containing protein